MQTLTKRKRYGIARIIDESLYKYYTKQLGLLYQIETTEKSSVVDRLSHRIRNRSKIHREFQADYNVALTAADVNLLHHCQRNIKNWR